MSYLDVIFLAVGLAAVPACYPWFLKDLTVPGTAALWIVLAFGFASGGVGLLGLVEETASEQQVIQRVQPTLTPPEDTTARPAKASVEKMYSAEEGEPDKLEESIPITPRTAVDDNGNNKTNSEGGNNLQYRPALLVGMMGVVVAVVTGFYLLLLHRSVDHAQAEIRRLAEYSNELKELKEYAEPGNQLSWLGLNSLLRQSLLPELGYVRADTHQNIMFWAATAEMVELENDPQRFVDVYDSELTGAIHYIAEQSLQNEDRHPYRAALKHLGELAQSRAIGDYGTAAERDYLKKVAGKLRRDAGSF